MKALFKYSFMALVAASALLTGACTDEVEYTAAPTAAADSTGVYFPTAAVNAELSPSQDKVVNITVKRTDVSKEQTVNVKVVRNDDNVFEVPSTVTFAAGQPTATLAVKCPDAQTGVTYNYEILLDTNDKGTYSQYTNQIASGSVLVIDYQNIGQGTFTSQAMGDSYNVDVYESKTPHWYKAIALYGEEGKDVIFKVNDDNTVTVDKQPAFTHSQYGTAYVAGKGVLKDGKITVSLELTVSAGSFGYYTEVLALPSGN